MSKNVKSAESLCEGYGSPARMLWSDLGFFFYCQPLFTAEPFVVFGAMRRLGEDKL